MSVCQSCGWGITLDFGRWKDTTGNVACNEKEDHSPKYGK